MSTAHHPAEYFLRPTPLAACLALAFAVTASPAFANARAPTMQPLPPAKAAAVERARANARAKAAHPAAITVVANCTDSGSGSLRDAMNHAASLDTIDLSHLACSRITLTTGALLADVDSLTLQGPADHHLTIDGGSIAHHYDNVIIHGGSGLLKIADLTIANAKYQDGAGLGGCIWSNSSVYLLRSTITGCTVSNTSAAGNASGGGVWARGNVNIIHSAVTNNTAVSSKGDAFGAGVYMQGGSSSFYDTFSGNIASASGVAEGGALFVEGSLGMSNSTVSGNQAQMGGGLFLDGRNQTFTSQIRDSTFSGNSADQVGGIFTRVGANFIADTIAKNTETTFTGGAGLYVEENSYINSTIVLLNTHAGDPSDLGSPENISATGSHNMLSSFTIISLPPQSFVFGEASDLGPLSDNGGTTLTHSLPANSAALDRGSPGATTWDQRGPGFTRSAGDGADIGAFERNPDQIFTNGFN